MSKAAYIPKDGWKEFVSALAKGREVYGPRKDGEAITFGRVDGADLPCLDRPALGAPKGVIFPQSEALFSFVFEKDPAEPTKTHVELRTGAEPPEAVILCGRPCDAKGFTIIDRVFLGVDPYYSKRRERTCLVTLTCDTPYTGCFCTSVGGSPAGSDGSDVLLTDIGHGYYAEAVTEKGEKILEGMGLADGAKYREEAEKQRKAAADAMTEAFPGGKGVKLKPAADEFWEEVSQKCLGCGACTYLCPTCYCFNITDEPRVASGERIRSWDSCMFPHFTKEASGHNPRALKSQRLRNRVGHKFVYYPEKYGEPACSGCGRCIRLCPVSMEISRIVAKLAEPSREEHGK